MTNLPGMTKQQKLKYLRLLQKKREVQKYNQLFTWFPEKDTTFGEQIRYSRHKYPLHLAFMAAGAKFQNRMLIAANQVGKTNTAAYELTCHLTGLYPDWWQGKTLTKANHWYVIGVTPKQLQIASQATLFGDIELGTGMIPKHLITRTKKFHGSDAYEVVEVLHTSGDKSSITFFTQKQGYEKIQGGRVDGIWFDEQADDEMLYNEAVKRTVVKKGMVIVTFSPMQGFNQVCQKFLPDRIQPISDEKDIDGYYTCNIGANDVPHLSEEQKMQLGGKASDPRQRAAILQGIAYHGGGQVYAGTVAIDTLLVDPFKIPKHWEVGYGLDFGYNTTAAVFGAKDPQTGIIYIFHEYLGLKLDAKENARRLDSLGASSMLGFCDPAGRGRSQTDGEQIIAAYLEHGLYLDFANNALTHGINLTLSTMLDGRLKIFKHLNNLIGELMAYKYDDKTPDKPAKGQKDHSVDSLRYLIVSSDRFEPYLVRGQSKDNVRIFNYGDRYEN